MIESPASPSIIRLPAVAHFSISRTGGSGGAAGTARAAQSQPTYAHADSLSTSATGPARPLPVPIRPEERGLSQPTDDQAYQSHHHGYQGPGSATV